MLRLPRTVLDPEIAGQYCVDGQVSMSTTRDHVILDLTCEDDAGEWVEGAEDSLSAIVGVRSELAAGDLRPLYLAWLSGYGGWERDEDSFGDEDEDELEPSAPAGLGSLTAPQRALADFLRLDSDLLQVAAGASPALPEVKDDARALATRIAKLPVSDKDRLLTLVAEGQAARARMELLRGLRGDPAEQRCSRPRRTVVELLDTAAASRLRREQQAAATAAAQQAIRDEQRAAARQRRLDELAQDPETAWADAEGLISTRLSAQYDAAVTLLRDLQELAEREGQAQAFARRFAGLREAHLRKPSLIARFDRAIIVLDRPAGHYPWQLSRYWPAGCGFVSSMPRWGFVARAEEHADLFWGLRGGSGNFGIVTEFEFRLHELGSAVLAGLAMFPMDRAGSTWPSSPTPPSARSCATPRTWPYAAHR